MSRMSFLDRLQTIAATAAITSAAWIVVGTVYVGRQADGTNGAQPAGSAARAAGEASAAPSAIALPAGAGLTIPVQGVTADQLRSSFDDARGGRRHEAIDIMAPTGTAVVAAAPGTVEKLFRSDAGGNTIYVRSPDRRTLYYYAHLQSYAPGLTEGQAVTAGERLGAVGSSGNADPAAPHLHFAVLRAEAEAQWWEPATAVDPFPLLRPS
jgi:murein DD-endopeptidase MepM/ murein hydrolase activator NlpD